MKAERLRVVASANLYERLPSGDAPSFEVLDPPANFYARYEGRVLDTLQLQEAQDNIVASGYMFDADQRAWVKAPLKRSAVDFLPHDDSLRFVARVLASDAPKADREDAAQMVRDIRRSLYAAHQAQAQPAPVPLTDEQIAGIASTIWDNYEDDIDRRTEFARDIERAHGIGEAKP